MLRDLLNPGSRRSADEVDRDLDRFIEKRHQVLGEEDRHDEDVFIEMTRRELQKTRSRNRWLWIRYFEELAWLLRRRADDYDRRARKLQEGSEV